MSERARRKLVSDFLKSHSFYTYHNNNRCVKNHYSADIYLKCDKCGIICNLYFSKRVRHWVKNNKQTTYNIFKFENLFVSYDGGPGYMFINADDLQSCNRLIMDKACE